ncbi:hypothetical protein HanPSC8_Chr06g0233671 [Helianthus annuus]|nr:hypothetical protein HanPSC8_Chr06g0233671 [Helianthus annuus]
MVESPNRRQEKMNETYLPQTMNQEIRLDIGGSLKSILDKLSIRMRKKRKGKKNRYSHQYYSNGFQHKLFNCFTI